MSKKIYGFGIIGCGAIARIHADAIKNIDNAELVAVFDYSYDYAMKFQETYKCKVYKTLEELLADKDIDIINICTPSGLHSKQVIACANAGKNIIVEKPMAITKEQMEETIKAIELNNVKAEVISQLRFTPSVACLKKAVDEGKLGKIYMADYRLKYYRSPEYYAQSGWRGTWAMDGGGALMNQGIHGIDLIQYIMGGVKNVYASCKTLGRDIEVEDTANVLVEYKNGAVGVIECTTLAKPGYARKIEVHGEKGSVVLGEDTIEIWDVDGVEKPAIGETVMNGSDTPIFFSDDYHKEQFIDLINAIEHDKTPKVDMYEGKKPVDIILAAYESSKTGKKIEI